MKRATIIRRSLVGVVCTVGVGALYLAPSLAGPPEQIAIPAPTEMPTMEPTPFETPFETPTPFESTTPEAFPTDTTASALPTNEPTTTYPTTIAPTTAPPYIPPKTIKPTKTKKPKVIKTKLGAPVVTISAEKVDTFKATWSEVSNAKSYKLSGCLSDTTKETSLVIKFPSSGECSKLYVEAIPKSTKLYKTSDPSAKVTASAMYGPPVLTFRDKSSDGFTIDWTASKYASAATKYAIKTECIFTPLAPTTGLTARVRFDVSHDLCQVTVSAVLDDDHTASEASNDVTQSKTAG